jgi:hypothetical protein
MVCRKACGWIAIGAAFAVACVSPYAVADELGGNDIFALDEISQSGLKSIIGRNIFIYNIDSRVIKDPDDFPFHKFSVWTFSRERNYMNFCTFSDGFICADPNDFEYRFDAGSICFERTRRSVAGCYSLVPKNNQLDWIDEKGRHVMTSFTAVYVDKKSRFGEIWKIFMRHMHHELQVLGVHKEEIILGLISLGLLDPTAKHQFDAPVRTAIVSFQRKAGIFPTGFVDEVTFKEMPRAAAGWYLEAAAQGDNYARYKLATAYYQGRGVSQDYAEAVKWYRLAAEQGHVKAQNDLGEIYDQGEGVTQDHAEAAKWYRLAAEQGLVKAQNNLGEKYDQGQGVTRDYAEAAKWYRQAAEQGHAEAQNRLGEMYDQGQGVKRSKAEAVKWYRKAAEQGHAKAAYKLGLRYMRSARHGASKDRVQAFMWLRVAASRLGPDDRNLQDQALKLRNEIAAKMTAQEIAEAERLASEWMWQHPL